MGNQDLIILVNDLAIIIVGSKYKDVSEAIKLACDEYFIIINGVISSYAEARDEELLKDKNLSIRETEKRLEIKEIKMYPIAN